MDCLFDRRLELTLDRQPDRISCHQRVPSFDLCVLWIPSTGLSIHGSLIVSSTAAWAIAFVMVGLAEEFAFRGYMQFTITTGIGFWPAALLMSLLFGLAHAGNPGESKTGLA